MKTRGTVEAVEAVIAPSGSYSASLTISGVPVATGTGVADHGSLTGLSADDHPQYSLADGSRAFSGPVGGIDPVASSDLTTRNYVDGEVVAVSGHLQTEIDKIDPSTTLQDAYDNGGGTISTTAGKPLELTGTGELTAEAHQANAVYTIEVHNGDAQTISPGFPVYAKGYSGARLSVARCRRDTPSQMPCVGVMYDLTGVGSTGRMIVRGISKSINLAGSNVGDPVYAGNLIFQFTRPTAATDIVQRIGTVLVAGNPGRYLVSIGDDSFDLPNISEHSVFAGDSSHHPAETTSVNLTSGAFSSSLTISGTPVLTGFTGLIEHANGFFEYPADEDYTLIQSSAVAFDIEEFTAQTDSGTLSGTLMVDGVEVEGVDNQAWGTSEIISTATSAKSVSVGSKVTLGVSGTVSPYRFAWTYKTVRT